MNKTIIPIAGGKGGVGKTFFSANLSVALAEMGYSTIVVDMDLGGSNLYSFLGLANKSPGIGDFLKARNAELEDLLVSTQAPNLQFLPGDGLSPFMANIPYAQKIRLISHIVKLPAQYIMLDLGAGTSFNTLDFFRLSPNGLVITTPEYPSIMNMMTFLKLFLLRIIEGSFKKDDRIREMLHSLFKQPLAGQQRIMDSVRAGIGAIDPEAAEKIAAVCRSHRPRVIFNMGEHPEEMMITEQINRALADTLSLEVDYFGFVFNDPMVRQSVKKRTLFLTHYRDSPTAKSIKQIAERIVKFWGDRIQGSAERIYQHACNVYGDTGTVPPLERRNGSETT